MRVVSWNMSGRTSDAAWRHLLDVLKPDVALLQEARPLPSIKNELGDRLQWQEISGVSWGTAVLTPAPAERLPVTLTTEWMDFARIVGVDATLAGRLVRFVSVHPHYGAFDEALLEHRPDLDPKLASARYVWSCDVAYALARQLVAGAEHFIVGGDWNTARLFDAEAPDLDPGTGQAFFDRAAEDGWHDCYFGRHRREGRTWFRGRDRGYQLDHVFADGATGATVKDSWIDERAAVAPRLSDHAPLVIDFGD